MKTKLARDPDCEDPDIEEIVRRHDIVYQAWLRIRSTTINPNPQTLIQHGNTDPFNSTSFPLQASDHKLVLFYQAFFMAAVWSSESSTRSRAPAIAAWNENVQDVIADDSRLHALLACALSLKAIILPDAKAKSQAQSQALKHKNLSMEALRRRLADGVPEIAAIPAVHQLAATEYYSGNLAANVVHTGVVKRLVEHAGGLHKLPWSLQREIVIGDVLLALRVLGRPHFAPEDWDPGPWSQHPLGRKYSAPVQADMPALHPDLPTDVARDFEAQRECFTVMTLVTTSTFAGEDTPGTIFDWLHVRRYSLTSTMMHRYADTQDRLRAPWDAVTTALRACTAVALVFCCAFIRTPSTYFIRMYVPYHHLRTLMERLLPLVAGEGRPTRPNWMLWLFFVGALEEELFAMRHPTPETRWFSIRFLELAGQLDLGGWEGVEGRLGGFLYKREPLRPFLEAIWEKREWMMVGRKGVLPSIVA